MDTDRAQHLSCYGARFCHLQYGGDVDVRVSAQCGVYVYTSMIQPISRLQQGRERQPVSLRHKGSIDCAFPGVFGIPDSPRMTSVTSACLCWTLLSVCVLVLASDEQNTIAAESGEDVTLKCQVTKAKTFRTVKWSRADLGNEYVLLFRDGQSDPEEQHPSFKNRVDLQDTQMKNGDVSLSLKDVTAADEGTYQCRVFVSSWELISTVSLRVQPPGPSGGGSVGLIVGLSVSAVLLLVAVVVGFLIYKKLKPQDSY